MPAGPVSAFACLVPNAPPRSSAAAPIVIAPSAAARRTVRRPPEIFRSLSASVGRASSGAVSYSGISVSVRNTMGFLPAGAGPVVQHGVDLVLAHRKDELADRSGSVDQHE